MAVLRYQSGEEIRKGDRVTFHGNPATVEFVASEPGDDETTWFVEKFGGGVMILDPMVSGRTFIRSESLGEYEDLEFVGRGNPE